MNINIYNTNENTKWTAKLNSLPDNFQDIYSTPEYYKINENFGAGKAYCFVYESDKGSVIYPFLKNNISSLNLLDLKKEFYDIQGAYGYNGAYSSSTSSDLINEFEKEFIKYCKDSNILSEFTRFNPLIKNEKISKYLEISKVNKNIVVDLKPSEDLIWKKHYAYSVRKNVQKAKKYGLIFKKIPGSKITKNQLNDFKNVYFETLNRRNADKFYYFNEKYFENLTKLLGDNSSFFFVLYKKKVISCELVIYSKLYSYSFLGGTLSNYFEMRPNDFLKSEIINSLKKDGIKYFCLGGGIKKNDSIYFYKKRFSINGERDFFIGRRIYNKEIYTKLINAWNSKFPEKKDLYKNYFLKYRK